ncbi:hypothetical protein OG887_44245 (plasmid) [Streptomyces sp. NBC_00053]|uniref:Uncharacterized protein n=1 Tax=Streptomyces sanglieri TaxID=193460 RepID=A0ABW2WPZ3_9ACTN|nr:MULTISPECIES: hypothetical protein [unclassified Streptomyces]MCX4399994.1 hypothetical protein [Streptomyces sp. NBC_01767]MCX5106896.1 hypothetical protein [Streptomyces sp. NBC_00439]MCX5506003.1 hypothetical protein [Streptomyces sp. NBC_00052]MCX5554342.1 hypothetical protein [Streptomyces sp. NBC_00051]
MPRIRPGRVRTKHTNRRAPLLLSTMDPEDFNVRPGETKTIACPDCRTWRRIMGDKVLKIREHCISDKVAEGDKHTACLGSDQVVVINIDVKQWQAKQDRLLRDAMPQENRRAAQQFYKPLPAPAAPVARIKAEATLETTRQSYLAHRKGCTRCVGGKHHWHCQDGATLARSYILALQEEPARREARAEQERQERRAERKRTAPSVRKAQWAEHGGRPVETMNNQCRKRPTGMVSDFRGPQVPLAPKDAEAHDRRQVELGRQYARRTPAA